MRCSIVLLALAGLAAAKSGIHSGQQAADQDLLKKQLDVIQLLDQITEDIPNDQLQALGESYDIESNAQQYQNPIIVKYYAGAVKAGLVQPKGTPYCSSIPQLRKEAALLHTILLGAQNYQTFLNTAAWARVHVNEAQFVKALTAAILQRPDTKGVILPPPYEILPHYYFDSRIIQEAQDIAAKGIQGQGVQNVVIPVNYTAFLPHGEHQLSYFTQDPGLAAYYAYINLAGYILPQPGQHGAQQQTGGYQQSGVGSGPQSIGHGSRYYYLHQQLLAHYQLNRLSNGLGPIQDIDLSGPVKTPFQPNLRYTNGLQFPGRPEILSLGAQKTKLVKAVNTLMQRLYEAIDSGHVITPQGAFLSLYQPQGLDILGDLIQGTGRSINPRYYGSLQAAARQLLGNAPEPANIWDYTPSVLELGQTAVRDPAFYQLYKKVIKLFQHYQNSLPAYQNSDLVLPGVTIQNVDVSELTTYFSDYIVDLNSATVQGGEEGGQTGQQGGQGGQQTPNIQGLLKRLDHKPYQYQITVQGEKHIPGCVVRVYLGPKYDFHGQPISISQSRHLFVELDQFIQDIQQGQNVIVRSSQQAPSQSHDWPSVQDIEQRVGNAIRSQEPFYITEPHQILSFPARLALPKGTPNGLQLQLLVVITGPAQPNVPYGPVVPEHLQTYQKQHYQVVNGAQYQQYQSQVQAQGVTKGIQQTVEVLPHLQGVGQEPSQVVNTHNANLYTEQHGQYPYGQQAVYGQGYGQAYGQGGIYGQSGLGQGQGQPWQSQQWQSQQWQAQQHKYKGQQQHQAHFQHGVQVGPQGGIQGAGVQGGIQGSVPGGLQGVQSPGMIQSILAGGQSGMQGGVQGGQGQVGVQGQLGMQGVAGMQGMQGMQGGVHGVPGLQNVAGMQGIQGGQGIPDVAGVQGVQTVQTAVSGAFSSGQCHGGGFQGVYQVQKDVVVSEYAQNLPISEIIGGSISLDGKPLGYPLDRPLAPGALAVPNIYVQDVLVYHAGQTTNEINWYQQ